MVCGYENSLIINKDTKARITNILETLRETDLDECLRVMDIYITTNRSKELTEAAKEFKEKYQL